MTGGYTGKILRLNLTNGTVSTIDTSDYEEWGGGNGIGGAIFWDLAVAPGNWDMLDGFDPRNVVTLMTSPLSGTLAPAVAGRTEVQGINVYSYPICWFTRSGFGGRFAGMLKAAGWDGIVLEGKASSPVWINIVNDRVSLEDAEADGLWGLDTWETQVQIWGQLMGQRRLGEWLAVGDAYSTQMPAVVAIGPAGENLCRNASLVHDAGNAAGQGGFGGIFGSKNLKAISVRGTGSVEVADQQALMDARLWYDGERPDGLAAYTGYVGNPTSRQSACQSCPLACRKVTQNTFFNESQCFESHWYQCPNISLVDDNKASGLLQRYGVNCCDIQLRALIPGLKGSNAAANYLQDLYKMGIFGPGKQIDSSPLPMDSFDTFTFVEPYLRAISYRQGIGDDLAEGIVRAAKKWGRLEQDLDSGILTFPQWGYMWHHTLPTVEWTYSSLLGDRDINEHICFIWHSAAIKDALPAETIVNMLAEKTIPYTGDPFMFNYTWQGNEAFTEGIYSDHFAKRVAWDRHYNRFYRQALGFCDWGPWPKIINTNATAGDNWGTSPEAEPKFFNAITGKNMTFADGMEIGRKIWNRDRAIWILQGRHRDMEKLSGFMLKPGASGTGKMLPVHHPDGTWTIETESLWDMYLDYDGVEQLKTLFFELEGWDTSSGWPTRSTLEGLDLGFVADKLASAGKLGT